VPHITLNPKKARRSLKKGALRAAPAAAARLPIESCSAAPYLLPAGLPQVPTPLRLGAERPVSRQVADPHCPQPATAPRGSWYEITEEDDDGFASGTLARAAKALAPCLVVAAPQSRPALAAAAASAAPLPQLCGLPVDALAEILLFSEVSALGRTAAACAATRACTWEDSDFWTAYGGPNFAVTAEARQSPPAVRRTFQRWVHGLEGEWGTDFAASAATRHHADVFDDADYLLAGLQAQDKAVDSAHVAVFVEALLAELRCFDADCDKTRERALAAVMRACAREALLPAGAVEELRSAFEASVEQTHGDRFGQVSVLPSKPAPAAPTLGQRASQSAALSALAVLGARHQGLRVEAAVARVNA